MADIEDIIRAAATEEYPTEMADDTGVGDDIAPLAAEAGAEEVATEEAVEEAVVVAKPKVEAKPAVTEPAKTADGKAKRQTAEEILAEEGIKDRQPGGRVNAIPHPRVKEMMDRSLSRRDAIHADEIKTVAQERDEARRVISQRDATHELFEKDPERFMAAAAEVHPGYKRFLQQTQAVAGGGQGDPKREPAAGADPMPRPDVKLSDGSMTYSLDQLDKRDEWNRRQAVREAEAAFGERLKPFEEDKKAREAREADHSRREKATQQVGAAQKWPRWTEHEEAIHGVLQANRGRGISLEQAYLHVVVPKLLKEIEGLSVDRAKIKAEVMKELSSAPRVGRVASPTGGRPAAKAEPAGSPEDRINSVILDSIQHAGLV